MVQPFIGEIRMFAGPFAPRGFSLCDGQTLAVSQNESLYSLLGTVYGGDGRTTVGLPDLRGRLPIHMGTGPGFSSRRLGASGGQERVVLAANQLGGHRHSFSASLNPAGDTSPANNTTAVDQAANIYGSNPPSVLMAEGTTTNAGESDPHDNVMPFLCLNFIISLTGLYPSRN